jgi:predicted phosphodiesterase
MKFDLISDFHVEMNVAYDTTRYWKEGEPNLYAWHEDRKSDVLVIAGDSANYHEDTACVVMEASRNYEHVVFVDGNHEHYTNSRNGWTVLRDMEWFNTQFNKNSKKVENVTYLDGEETFKIDKTLFIGANGWYNFTFARGMHFKAQWKAWQQHSNDPVCIRFGKKNKPHKLAERHMELLKAHVVAAQSDDTVEEIVVVTHTLPIESAFGQFGNPSHPFYPLNGAYGNELMKLVWEADEANKIKTWCFGHTHERRDFFEHGVHFMCNPRGYRGEKKWHGLGFEGIQQVDTEEPETQSAFGEVE